MYYKFSNIKFIKKFFIKFKLFSNIEKFLKKNDCKLIIFPTGSNKPLSFIEMNYVSTLLDICHLDYPYFPEIKYYENFDEKEIFLRECMAKSIFCLTVSEKLKEKVEEYYPYLKEKCVVIPLSISHLDKNFTEIKSKIEDDYIFYPAHYSAHKNHYTILKSIKYLKEKNRKINFVFCGHDKGNLSYLIKLSKELGVLIKLNLIDLKTKKKLDIYFLNSRAVLFMSLFGPVNIPPLESWYYNKPLISSNQFFDQLGDAAILVDPLNYKKISDAILQIDNKDVVNKLISNGQKKLNEIEDDLIKAQDNFLEKINNFEKK